MGIVVFYSIQIFHFTVLERMRRALIIMRMAFVVVVKSVNVFVVDSFFIKIISMPQFFNLWFHVDMLLIAVF